MKARIENMMRGGRSDAGFSTMEIIIYLAIAAILGTVVVGLYFVLTGNANENKATAAGSAAHNAVASFYADYGDTPANAAAVDTYLTEEGDEPIAQGLPTDTDLAVYDTGLGRGKTVTLISSPTEFGDVIVIDQTGQVQKFPTGDAGIPDVSTLTAIATWSS